MTARPTTTDAVDDVGAEEQCTKMLCSLFAGKPFIAAVMGMHISDWDTTPGVPQLLHTASVHTCTLACWSSSKAQSAFMNLPPGSAVQPLTVRLYTWLPLQPEPA